MVQVWGRLILTLCHGVRYPYNANAEATGIIRFRSNRRARAPDSLSILLAYSPVQTKEPS
jgi:hypothetical protein